MEIGHIVDRLNLSVAPSLTYDMRGLEAKLRGLNIMGKYIQLETQHPHVAALVVKVMTNLNKVVIVNGYVVSSFDSEYGLGELVSWFKDFDTVVVE